MRAKGWRRGTYKRFTQVIAEELPDTRVVALSGPSHAEGGARRTDYHCQRLRRSVEAAEKSTGTVDE